MAVEQKAPSIKQKTADIKPSMQRQQPQQTGQSLELPRPSSVLQRAQADPSSLTSAELDVLQRTVGLRATQRMLANSPLARVPTLLARPIQTKLAVGPVGDQYEQEADRVANQVMRQMRSGKANAPTPAQRQQELEGGLQRKEESDLPAMPISHLQRKDEERQSDPMLGGGELSGDVESAVQKAKGGGRRLDDSVRGRMEQAFKADFSGVTVHADAESNRLNRSMHARAFTTGQDVFFKAGEYNPGSSDGQKLIAHELTHVVQQQPVLSRKYADAHPDVGDHSNGEVIQRTSLFQQAPVGIQRNYAALSPMAKARVDQQADEKYAAKAQEFEFKMAPIIMTDDRVNAVVDVLLTRVKRIVDAWAVATGREKGAAYEREFGWKGGDEYYAAFEMTSANITKIFDDTHQPLRLKLKLVYNAVRNNNLAKWLKLAAIELDRQAKNKTPRDWKIKTSTQSVTKREGNKTKIVKGRSEKETVKVGFAEQSGLKDWLTATQVGDLSKTAETEKLTEHKRSKRDVFGMDRFSNVMGWKAETHKANKERTGGASNALRLSEQRTLRVEDMADLTDMEIDQMYIQKGLPKPDAGERLRFRSDPKAKLNWSQGGEFYDINLGSDSAKEAATMKARLEAGISGSTDLMLHAMQNLGLSDEASMKGMRLALAGWMLANRDHSFYEIFKAAELYGVPFEKDPTNPGMEYESASNLSPMVRTDFTDVLPEKKFPRHFLSTEYKDTLSDDLPEATKDKTAMTAALRSQGVSDTLLLKLDERGVAELTRLSEHVARANLDPGQRPALRMQSIRRVKQQNAFVYLGNTLGIADAEAMLNALLKTHHGGKGLAPVEDNKLETLADAGIPRMILDTLPPKEIANLDLVRKAVQSLRKNPKTGKPDMKPVNTALSKTKVSANHRPLIKAVLMQTYHGNGILTDEEKLQANVLRMMVSTKESGAKKLSVEQLEDLKAPTPKGGTQISDDDYWASTVATGKLTSNLGIVANSFLAKMKEPDKQKIRLLIFAQIGKNDHEFIEAFKDVEKEEGFPLAVTSYCPPAFIEQQVLPPSAYDALTGLRGLHPKELGAIFQYTTALYKPIVNAANSFSTEDFGTGDLTNKQWGSPLGTLKYSGNMMQALASGLAKLPIYPDPVYRLETTRVPYLTQGDTERQKVAASYKPGTVQSQNYPMSTMKTLNSQFASTNYGNATFSIVYEIVNVKTGHDIQYVSDQVKEEEVLFEPGSRLRVLQAYPNNPNNIADKHVWVRFEEV